MGNLTSDRIRREHWRYVHRCMGGHRPSWRGVDVVKYPQDLILYSQAIHETKPDWIIETGTLNGGTTLFLADMLTLFGGSGSVISIDLAARFKPEHPRVEYMDGRSSADRGVVAEVSRKVQGGRVMVVLDSDHSRKHVYRELRLYGPLVTPGMFLVVEDCWRRDIRPASALIAVDKFLSHSPQFQREPVDKQFAFALTRDGWLRRIS